VAVIHRPVPFPRRHLAQVPADVHLVTRRAGFLEILDVPLERIYSRGDVPFRRRIKTSQDQLPLARPSRRRTSDHADQSEHHHSNATLRRSDHVIIHYHACSRLFSTTDFWVSATSPSGRSSS